MTGQQDEGKEKKWGAHQSSSTGPIRRPRPNPSDGKRSKESWYKSQREGDWVITLSGLAFLVTALMTPSASALLMAVGLTLLATLVLIFYSFLVGRGDHRRERSL